VFFPSIFPCFPLAMIDFHARKLHFALAVTRHGKPLGKCVGLCPQCTISGGSNTYESEGPDE
jgi:hypothetical protein